MATVAPVGISFRCPVCKKKDVVVVPAKAYAQIARGVSVQIAWPDSTDNEREPLISGIHGRCFDEYMGVED